jgi:hypothetical protein
MTKAEYMKALAKLKLTPYGAAKLLGISLRQSHRYAAGDQPVKETVAILLDMYLRHGLPPKTKTSP